MHRHRHADKLSTLVFSLAAALCGCATSSLRSAVVLEVNHAKSTPRDASVYIDEQYIGPLYYVSAYGVRLPVGEHRITVTKEGYFPWDRLVEADRKPLSLTVELVEVPD